MKRLLCLAFGLLLSFVSFSADKYFDTLIVFGDSLSDDGNLYRYLWHKLPASPPYYAGRFSNGPIWAEQMYQAYFPQDELSGFQNYAVGGAGAVLAYKQYLPYTLAMELNNYFYWHTYGKKDSSLYVVWIGGNNYLNAPTNVEAITDSVVNAIASAVERLIGRGANKFFIPNLPDLGHTPFSVEANTQSLLSTLTHEHNRKLAEKIAQLEQAHPDVTIVPFDVYSLFEQAKDYGFNNTTSPCYFGGYTGWLLHHQLTENNLHMYLSHLDARFDMQQLMSITNNPQLREAASVSYVQQLLPEKNKEEPLNCEGYIFWDRVHPTTAAHYYLALKAKETLDAAGFQAFDSTKLQDVTTH